MVKSLKHGAAYNLDDVKRLVSQGSFNTTRRVERFILGHVGEDVYDAILEVFEAAGKEGFRKTVELDYLPGVLADVYHVEVFDDEYYLKFYVEEERVVVVLSCCIDGMNH